MNWKFKFILVTAAAGFAFGCRNNNATTDANLTISPDAGTNYKSGDKVVVKAHYASGFKPDSVVYLVDSANVGKLKDSAALTLKTDTMPLGPRVITAKVYSGGKSQDVSTNIVLLPAKAPEAYTYKVIRVFPHDTSCYTEGLLYQDGIMYESGGGRTDDGNGQSSLRKWDISTGRIIKKIMVNPKVFAEGISIVGNKLIQLTYTEKIGYVYDKDSFRLLSTFTNNVGVEGWGLCSDGKKLYMDDKTNRVWFLNKDSYKAIGYVDVYDDKGPVQSINELEYINGKLYANIWQTNNIIVIDPRTGAVLQKIDLGTLYPEPRTPPAEVLNGIAYDAKGKRIFITGKKWPHLYQVEFMRK